MRASIVSIGMLIAAVAVSACGASGPVVTMPPGPHLTVVANNLAFDTDELLMTADEDTLIYFSNLESDAHNIAIHQSKDDLSGIFVGELINRGAIVYDVPALDAGEYHFNCTVHPNMAGTVRVSP